QIHAKGFLQFRRLRAAESSPLLADVRIKNFRQESFSPRGSFTDLKSTGVDGVDVPDRTPRFTAMIQQPLDSNHNVYCIPIERPRSHTTSSKGSGLQLSLRLGPAHDKMEDVRATAERFSSLDLWLTSNETTEKVPYIAIVEERATGT
ncbi:hypothetical protein FOZ62_027696, partial [Perkinsus olseni]